MATSVVLQPEPPPRCDECRFYCEGDCRRYAPRSETVNGYKVWPKVSFADWCGEFDRKLLPPEMRTEPKPSNRCCG
jgi:hypothetical protein